MYFNFFSAPTDLTATHARNMVISFISPINKIYHSLFIKNPSESYNFTAYTEPINWLAWLVLLVFIASVPPILYIASRYIRVKVVEFSGHLSNLQLYKINLYIHEGVPHQNGFHYHESH